MSMELTMNRKMKLSNWFLLVVLFLEMSSNGVKTELVKEVLPEEPLGNIMDINWKLPEDGGGGSSQCMQDIRKMYSSLSNMTLWAFQMWEATAGETNGWAQGSVYQFGNFDECLDSEEQVVEKQYCLATINITHHPGHQAIKTYKENFEPYDSFYDVVYYAGDQSFLRRDILHWGICSPASCSFEELEQLMQTHIDTQLAEKAMKSNSTNLGSIPKIQLMITQDSCQRQQDVEQKFGVGAQVFFWLVGLSTLAVLMASSYHCYLLHKESDSEVECPRIVKIYSAIGHLKSLNKRETGDTNNGLDVLWGIRFLSILFIISAHRFGTRLATSILNRNELEAEYHQFASMFVCRGDVVVDSFLALSGLLSVFGILNNTKDKKSLNYPLLILYRYVRISAAYAVVIMFTAFVLPFTATGPTWPIVLSNEGLYCRENWWVNLLMLNNYYKVDRMCLAHSWYIPCDFHYFLLSLVMCTLFKMKSRRITALSVLSILIVLSMLVPAIITYIMRLPATMLFFDDFLTHPREHKYFQTVYIPSHTRASPHLIGILTGYLIFKYHNPEKKYLSPVLSAIGGYVSFGILLGVVASGTIFYEPNHPYSVLEATFYAALQRTIWGIAICSLIACCVFGEVPFMSSFLSWSVWVPLGKLVYGAYVVHMGLQIRSATQTRSPHYKDNLTMFGESLGDSVIAFTCSLFLYLTFEAPIRSILGTILVAKIELPRKHSVAQDSYTPQGNDNKTLELEVIEGRELKNNFEKLETLKKFDNSHVTGRENVNVNYKL